MLTLNAKVICPRRQYAEKLHHEKLNIKLTNPNQTNTKTDQTENWKLNANASARLPCVHLHERLPIDWSWRENDHNNSHLVKQVRIMIYKHYQSWW